MSNINDNGKHQRKGKLSWMLGIISSPGRDCELA